MGTSLNRLNQISSHPTISKGIRAVRIDLRFYSRLLASNERDYIGFAEEQLEQSIISLHRSVSLDRTQAPNARGRDVLVTISRAKRISDSWMTYNATRRMPTKNLKANAAVRAIMAGHEEYRRHFSHQDCILRNGFAQAVAEAVRRMPQAVSLLLWEGDVDNDRFLVKNFGTTIDVQQAISEVYDRPMHWLIMPMTWDIINTRPEEKLPTDLLWQIPIQLYRAGVRLVQLGISLNPGIEAPSQEIYKAWDFNDVDVAELNAAARYLERFQYHGPSEKRRHVQTSFSKYMCAMNSGPWLKNFEASFLSHAARHHRPLVRSFVSIESLVSSITTPDLVCKILGGFFRNIEEIEAILYECPSHLILVRPDLCWGRWAEALDVLRSRTWTHIQILNPIGGECDNMHIDKYQNIFGPPCVSASTGFNRASLYICRDESQTLNPFRFVPDEQEESSSSS